MLWWVDRFSLSPRDSTAIHEKRLNQEVQKYVSSFVGKAKQRLPYINKIELLSSLLQRFWLAKYIQNVNALGATKSSNLQMASNPIFEFSLTKFRPFDSSQILEMSTMPKPVSKNGCSFFYSDRKSLKNRSQIWDHQFFPLMLVFLFIRHRPPSKWSHSEMASGCLHILCGRPKLFLEIEFVQILIHHSLILVSIKRKKIYWENWLCNGEKFCSSKFDRADQSRQLGKSREIYTRQGC